MNAWIWILIVLLFGFLAFGQPDEVARQSVAIQEVQPAQVWQPVSIGDVDGVIVGSGDASLFVDSLGLDLDDDAYWRPAVADVEAAEAALTDEAGELDHMRQYAGYTEDGERKIFINGFCDALGVDWRERPVFVDDGGECFFTAIYNVESGEVERFQFNGQA